MHGFQAEKARKSTKSPICMTRARPRICMNFQTVFAGCQLFTRSTFCAWFAVRFLAVQRTEILLLHACCSKKLVCTCISIPFLEKLFSTLTRFFLYSCKFHTAVLYRRLEFAPTSTLPASPCCCASCCCASCCCLLLPVREQQYAALGMRYRSRGSGRFRTVLAIHTQRVLPR